MIRTFTYGFEELPLVVSNGIEAGLINGCVEVEYDAEGVWGYDEVCLEGYQPLTQEERKAGKKPWVFVKAPEDIADMIVDRLNGEWRFKVESALSEHLASEREDAADARADMRRDEMMLGRL